MTRDSWDKRPTCVQYCRHVRPRASCMAVACRERWLERRRSHELFLSNIKRLDEERRATRYSLIDEAERRARYSLNSRDEANISEITGYRFRF